MKIYNVYLKKSEEKPLESVVFVPEAFSLLAIIYPLNLIWAVMNRAWLFFTILLVYFLSSFPMSYADAETAKIAGMVKLALFPFLGIWANDFWIASLKSRGYTLETVVSGRNESEAQLRFYELVNNPAYAKVE